MPRQATHPDVVPMLSYVDCGRAMDWLVDAFGFTEQRRLGDVALDKA